MGWSAVRTADLDVLRCHALRPWPCPSIDLMEDPVTTKEDTVETWSTYGDHQLTRGLELPEPDRWDWGHPGHRPRHRSPR
ncbi:hypothetical protein ACFV1B_10025 [Streptomyces sp. NPDC059637]|uniref:hypothetical protein n=1 Tax=Streptomyces sp. NPDC059637 TaxID=3347752 RepID=UPI0036BA4F6C